MKKIKESDQALSGINIVPVIGVTLVLLVIQMVLSPIMEIPSLEVDLPEAVSRETKDQNVTVSMAADGSISVDTQIINWDNLPQVLRSVLKDREEDLVVIVRADRDLPYGAVEKLIRIVNRNVGKRAVAVATRQRGDSLENIIQ